MAKLNPSVLHMFEFEKSQPRSFAGGTLHRATKEAFPVLKDLAVQTLHLNENAIREPHLHPNAEQLDYCISGKARVGIIGPDGSKQLFELEQGSISFVPQGYIHWIENIGQGPLHFMVVLSDEEPETIELSEILSGVPKDTLAKALGLPKSVADSIPEKTVTISDGKIL